MPISHYLKEIGRGARGAKALDRHQAQDLFGQVLDGQVSDLEVGAFCIAMRIKGETAEEMCGFLDAVQARCQLLPATERPVLVLPSYNGARKLPVLTPLLALLLAREGYPVLLHQAWQQAADDPPRAVRFAAGTPCDRHAPVEGLLSLRQERHLELELHTWVNRCDADGFLVASERLQHKRRLIPGQLTYLDHPSLGALIRVRPR